MDFRRGWTVYGLAVTFLLALGAAVRIYGAWANRYITDPDCGVVALMARHMATGKPWPVFFYGQSYMGSLEPMISALLCRLFGVNGFCVSLGPALAAVAALFFLYLWSRDAGGRIGAVATLVGSLIGPSVYFMFQFAARGGYMMTLLFDAAMLWLAARLAARLWQGERPGAGGFLLLGVLAGLGWWTNPIVVSAMVTAAVLLAVGMRLRVWCVGTAAGAAGFLMGSLPFWIWNITHGWDSFQMLSNVGHTDLADGGPLLVARGLRLIGLTGWPEGWRRAVAGLAVLLVFAGPLGMAWNAVRERRRPDGFWATAAAFLFLAVSIAFFVTSDYARYNTARYLVPMVPPAAVLVGVTTRLLAGRVGAWAAFLPVVLLAASHLPALGELHTRSAATAARQASDRRLAENLATRGVDTVYGHFLFYPLNFNLGEAFRFTEVRGDRYRPLAQGAELSDRIGFFDNHGGVREFLNVSGGAASVAKEGGHRLEYRLRPPEDDGSEIEPTRWASVTDNRGTDIRSLVADRNTDTGWTGRAGETPPEWIEIHFTGPEDVRMIRLLGGGPNTYPAAVRFQVWTNGAADWSAPTRARPVTDFFWSGGRPYWAGRRFRLECRWDAQDAKAIRVLCTERRGGGHEPWCVTECQVFGPGEPMGSETNALPALMDLIRQRPIRRLYADRWVSNRVHVETDGRVSVEREPHLFPENTMAEGGHIDWSPDMALVVRAYDAGTTRRALAGQGIVMTETPVGPWVCFDFSGAAVVPSGDEPFPLYWSGFACLTGHSGPYAHALLRRARALLEAGQADAAFDALDRAVAYHPNAITVAGDLLERLRMSRPPDDLARWDALWAERMQPEHPIGAVYPGGLTLVGVSVEPARVRPGESVTVSYFWRVEEGGVPDEWMAFVHFRASDVIFQDDHAPLSDQRREAMGGAMAGEVFREERVVTVPATAPSGPYTLAIGLYHRRTHARLRPRTSRPMRHRAILEAGVLDVEP